MLPSYQKVVNTLRETGNKKKALAVQFTNQGASFQTWKVGNMQPDINTFGPLLLNSPSLSPCLSPCYGVEVQA